MRKYLIVLTFLFTYSGLYCQNWFQENDRWLYRYKAWSAEGFEELAITGDTIINSQAYQIMHLRRAFRYYQYPNNPAEIWEQDILVYEDNDKVYYLDELFGLGEVLLYDFSAEVGDQVLLINECEEQYFYEIIETGIDDFEGETRRFQRVVVNIPEFYPNDTFNIVEGIGAIDTYFFINQALLCFFDTESWFIMCYSTDSLEYNPGNQDCEAIDSFIVSDNEPNLQDAVKVYPTLFKDVIYIEKQQPMDFQINIYHSNGVRVFHSQKATSSLQLGNLVSGIYFVELIDKDGLRLVQKVIRQN